MTMTSPKTIQQLFNQTDWLQLRLQKESLVTAKNCAEIFNKYKVVDDLEVLSDWLTCVQVAAEAEGYPAFSGKVKI